MEIVTVGRHTDVTDRFRQHVEEKLTKLTQLAPRAQRVDVEVTIEKNPRLASVRERVELTVRDKGPVIRAEAAADDRYAALDLALDKLYGRLRRARDRRKDHHQNDFRPSVDVRPYVPAEPEPEPEPEQNVPLAVGEESETQLGDSPVIIRQKVHAAEPMTIDDALYEMEMVGHDFFIFVNSETSRPSAVYRRRGWSYGVIELETQSEVLVGS